MTGTGNAGNEGSHVMPAREFDIKTVYEEWDRLQSRKGPKEVAGERAYQAISGGPSDGLPCRVDLTARR